MISKRVHEHGGGAIFGQIARTGIVADGEHIDDYHEVWSPSGTGGLIAAQTPSCRA